MSFDIDSVKVRLIQEVHIIFVMIKSVHDFVLHVNVEILVV